MLRMSIRTEDAYAHWISDLIFWSGWKTPETITPADVTRYLSDLATKRKVSKATQNQAFNALLFLFRRVLEKDFGQVNATRAKTSPNVPEFYTPEEVTLILQQLSEEFLLLAQLAYGTGMRLMELLRLRIKDVDFGNGLIIVRRGKGDKDRIVPLPKRLVEPLREQIVFAKNIHQQDLADGYGEVWLPELMAVKFNARDFRWQYVFPSRKICFDPREGKMRRHHLFASGFQQALKLAGEKAGLTKRVHPHGFRHSFATAFLQQGGGIPQLQSLLGHKRVETTMIYTHCVDFSKLVSPYDRL